MPRTEQNHYVNLIWQQRIHVSPDALDGLAPAARQHLETSWELVQSFLTVIKLLPSGMLRWWLTLPRGHIVIRRDESSYLRGVQTWRGNQYESTLYISAVQAATDQQGCFMQLIILLDSLLGSGPLDTGALFSDGRGATPELQSAAARFARLAQLGYGSEALGTSDPQGYLAITLYLAIQSPQELNPINPLVLKLYRQTLLSEAFWARQLR